jgi:5-methylcytosine-specific restriction enzyme A
MPWPTDPESRRRSRATYDDPVYRRNRKAALARAGRRCERCSSPLRLQVDHRIPVSQGGTHDLANLQVLCVTCHGRKTATEGNGFRRGSGPSPDPPVEHRTQW